MLNLLKVLNIIFKDKKGNITKITWTATDKGIGPHEFIEFPIVVANPKRKAHSNGTLLKLMIMEMLLSGLGRKIVRTLHQLQL